VEFTRIRLKNWRNFRQLDVSLRQVTYVLGANASGKSNLLDAFRFLRDISKPKGGGLQTAVSERGGIAKVRCLHARRDSEVEIDVEISSGTVGLPTWRYLLAFSSEGKGAQRILITRESVWKGGNKILDRLNTQDRTDTTLRTQTHLEQIQANTLFRPLVDFLASITYLHLVPQLLKYADKIGGHRLEDDPFGQGFLERLAKTPEKTRQARLTRIGNALKLAVPQFKELTFVKDDLGHPHLQAIYEHHRPNAGRQTEEHFSDGTLRLMALLWTLLDGNSLLLLEEPEISLNDAIVKEIPLLLEGLQKSKKTKRQVILSTHSEALLSNSGIDSRGVVLLESGLEGSTGRSVGPQESNAIKAGLSIAEVVLPKTRPPTASQLALW
jgi:predicted ATPase